jgi:pyruvate formate lyase activating enzyme
VNIKGIHKTSLIDFPGSISAIIFSGGCNLRCRYCHNPDLACNSCDLRGYSNEEALSFITGRKHLIDAVVLSGGEPTLSPRIKDFARTLKDMGLKVKLDTNGFNPDIVHDLVSEELLDYIAMDIKTSPGKYPLLTGNDTPFDTIIDTLDILRHSGALYELRTTCIPEYVTMDDLFAIRDRVEYVAAYFLQQFINTTTLDLSFHEIQPYPPETLLSFRQFVSTFADTCEVRGI